jgi:hypothetical protein
MANIKFSQFTTTSPADTVSLVGYLSTDNVKFTIADLKTQFNNSYVTLGSNQTITGRKQFTTFPILGDQAYTASYGSEVKLYSSHNADSRWIFNSVGVHNKIFSFRVNDLQRWAFRVNQDAESGSNAGTNFELRRYNDAGTFIDSPISITRSNGTVAFGGNIQLTGSMQLGESVTLSNAELQTLNGVSTTSTIQDQLSNIDADRVNSGTLAKARLPKVTPAVSITSTAGISGNTTAEVVLQTLTIPANTLSVGDVIRIFGLYSYTTTGTKVPRLKFGTTTAGTAILAPPGAIGATITSTQVDLIAIVTSTTNLRFVVNNASNALIYGVNSGALTNVTINLGVSNSFVFTVQKTTGTDTAVCETAFAQIITS